jgi:conjugative transposon TraM protein
MKIDFKKPKYLMPLLLLPFMFLLNYGILSFSEEEEPDMDEGSTDIQVDIGNVSEQVRNSRIDNKLDAFRSRYKRADGHTAIENLKLDVDDSVLGESPYNLTERRMLDSIDNALRNSLNTQAPPPAQSSYSNPGSSGTHQPAALIPEEDKALDKAIEQLKGVTQRNEDDKAKYEDPMELFRAQMALIDSISKANDPNLQDAPTENEEMPIQLHQRPRLKVKKATSPFSHFNTVSRTEESTLIKAIVDEELKKGTLDNRVRIRLLEDIQIGKTTLKQGSYLYALISGYESQRVKLSITTVKTEDKILPVQLHIYDNDGMEGLYVPASSFRKFSKDLGANSAGGVNIRMNQGSSSMDQFYMSTLQKLVTSTSQAMSKAIRKNKANLKYGTFIYLVDPDDLSENFNDITEN